MSSRVLYYGFNEENKIVVWSVDIIEMIFNNVSEMLKFFGYDKYEYVFMNNIYSKKENKNNVKYYI